MIAVKMRLDHLPFKERMAAEENAMRLRLAELVDDAFVAYREAGGTDESYAQTQWFQSVLFQAINETMPFSGRRLGALQLAIAFMERLIAHFQSFGLKPLECKPREIRKP